MSIAVSLTDSASLLKLLQVYEAEGLIFEHQSLSALTDALLNTLPLEFRQIAVGILTIYALDFSDSRLRASFIEYNLSHLDADLLPLYGTSFTELRAVMEAVETFSPLYIQDCMEKLDHIEAVRLKSPMNESNKFGFLSGGIRVLRRPYRYHWRWDGDHMIAEHEEYPNISPTWKEKSRVNRLDATPFRWQLPVVPSELYRVQRAFWRFHLYSALYAERPTLETGIDAALGIDRRKFLARLQDWEFEEMASVLPFLATILEKIYKPAVYANPRLHNEKSLTSLKAWKTHLGQTNINASDIYLWTHYDRPNKSTTKKRPSEQIKWYGDAFQQKWIAHQVSHGLIHIHDSYKQQLEDGNRIIEQNYPTHQYEPWIFFEAPIEAVMRWQGPLEHQKHNPWGATNVQKHSRKWPDAPDADEPNYCWRMKRLIFRGSAGSGWDDMDCYSDDCRALREVGYFFWDERDSTPEPEEDRDVEQGVNILEFTDSEEDGDGEGELPVEDEGNDE